MATSTTYNKTRNMRRLLYWVAQQQDICPKCGKTLINSTKDTEAAHVKLEPANTVRPFIKKMKHLLVKGLHVIHSNCEEPKKLGIESTKKFIFNLAQEQKWCPICGELLLPNSKLSDLHNLTYDHSSGSYDHAKKIEGKGKLKGGTFQHGTCHKKKTSQEKKPWLNSPANKKGYTK